MRHSNSRQWIPTEGIKEIKERLSFHCTEQVIEKILARRGGDVSATVSHLEVYTAELRRQGVDLSGLPWHQGDKPAKSTAECLGNVASSEHDCFIRYAYFRACRLPCSRGSRRTAVLKIPSSPSTSRLGLKILPRRSRASRCTKAFCVNLRSFSNRRSSQSGHAEQRKSNCHTSLRLPSRYT